MRPVHITLGLLFLALAATSAVGGVYLLRAHEGGGLRLVVAIEQPTSLAQGDRVLFGDKLVGRVTSVAGAEVTASIAAEYAAYVRQGSRFWVQANIGANLLCFDSPPDAGAAAGPGSRFSGLAARPEPHPSTLPPPVPRRLAAKPAWLCEVRVVTTVQEGSELVRDEARVSAGAIAGEEAGVLLVLAPAWLFWDGPGTLSERIRVEFAGGELCTGQMAGRRGDLCLLVVRGSAWQGAAAMLWHEALADGQALMLADFGGKAWVAGLADGTLEFRGTLKGGYIALVDGTNLAGFALPAVGETRGARWATLAGAEEVIEAARQSLR